MERPNTSFINVDIKPEKLEDLNEVITTACFSPRYDYNICYGTSKAVVKLLDIRERCDCTNSGLLFKDDKSKKNKNFFTEIITSISDAKITKEGDKILIRDFMTTKLWDIKMPKTPL